MIIVSFDGFRLFKYALVIGFVACVTLAATHDAWGWWL